MTAVTPERGEGLNPEDAFFEVFESYRPAPSPATDEVVGVLRPFAEAADGFLEATGDGWDDFGETCLTLGHLRRARSLLAKLEVRG